MQDKAITIANYEGIIVKFCRKFHARTLAAGFVMEYTDVYQDGIETFLRCRETFNAASGHQFSTYLTLSLRNNFNNSIKGRTPMPSIDAMAENAGEDGLDLESFGFMEDDCAHAPDWHLEVKQAIGYAQRQLSTWAQFALGQIMAPSAFLQGQLAQHQQEVAQARAAGADLRVKELSVEFIVRVFGPLKGFTTESQQKKLAKDIRAEFNEVAHALARQ